jgi:hypothetical protein
VSLKPDAALILADLTFSGPLVEWRGPAPYFFVAVPEECVAEVRYAARLASYGWGVVPVHATADSVEFRTSLFPREAGYLLPIKAAIRRTAGMEPNRPVVVRIVIAASELPMSKLNDRP